MAKSKLAIERDRFILSPKGRKLSEGVASGVYLQNRIEQAFLDGVEAGEIMERERIVANLIGRAK